MKLYIYILGNGRLRIHNIVLKGSLPPNKAGKLAAIEKQFPQLFAEMEAAATVTIQEIGSRTFTVDATYSVEEQKIIKFLDALGLDKRSYSLLKKRSKGMQNKEIQELPEFKDVIVESIAQKIKRKLQVGSIQEAILKLGIQRMD